MIALAAVQFSAKVAKDNKEYREARDILTSAQRLLQSLLHSSEDSPAYNTICEEYEGERGRGRGRGGSD